MDFQHIPKSHAIDPTLVSTIMTAPHGHTVTRQLGIVRGITVRSRNLITSIGAGFKAMGGGVNLTMKRLCEDTRTEAYNAMVEEAAGFGANCILGMRYEAHSIAEGLTEVLCYGTAVCVSKAE